MNASAFSVRKIILLTIPEVSSVQIWNRGYQYYLKLGLELDSTLECIKDRVDKILFEHSPAGCAYAIGTEEAPDGYDQFEAPYDLSLLSQSTGYTAAQIISTLNVLFPGSLISSISEDFSTQTFSLVQQPNGIEVSPEQINAKIGFITACPQWRVSEIIRHPLTTAQPSSNLDIIPSGLLGNKVWREAAERDEEFTLRFQRQAAEGLLRLDPEKRATTFVDDSIGSPIAIRPLLAVFDKVILSPSVDGSWNLDISPDEAVSLAASGKIQVTCPRNPYQYKSNFVRTIAEECPLSLIGPRASGLLAFAESVRRNPLLKQLLVDIDEARNILKILESVDFNDQRLTLLNQALVRSMKAEAINALHFNFVRGSLHGGVYGIGAIANEIHKVTTGRNEDLNLEFMSVGERIQLGAGFDAYIHPWNDDVFRPYYEYIARTVNTKTGFPLVSPKIGEILHGLDIPVYYDMTIDRYVELFNNQTTSEVRNLLTDVISKIEDPARIQAVTSEFRERSSEIQIRTAQIARLNIVGALTSHIPLHWSILNSALNLAINLGLPEIGKIRSVRMAADAALVKAFETDITSVRLARLRTDIRARRYSTLPRWLLRRFLR
ncbi:hypothetical protein D3C72_368550 [compost metagenome]